MKNIPENVLKYYKFSLIVWVILTVGLAFYALDLPSKLKGDGFEMDGEYEKVQQILTEDFDSPESTMLVVFEKSEGSADKDFHNHITKVIEEIEDLEVTTGIQSPLTYPEQMSDDTAYAVLAFDEDKDNMNDHVHTVRTVTEKHDDTMLTGASVINVDLNEASQRDLITAEMIGLPVALLVLLMAFGSLAAAIVPLIVGGVTVVISLGILTLLGNQMNLSVFLLNVTPMIGLALSIDFALLFINRYKEELLHSDKKQAILTTIRTAGKSIAFSAVCVFIGLAAMLLIQIDIFKTVAIGGMVVVTVALISSVTLLPSILYLLGDHLDKGKLIKRKKDQTAYWRKFAEGVMKRPLTITLLAVLLLAAGIIPVKDLVLSIPDETSLPDSFESRKAFGIVNEEFKLKENSLVYIIAERDDSWTDEDGLKEMELLIDAINKEDAVKSTSSLYSVSKAGNSETLYEMLKQPESAHAISPAVDQFINDQKLLIPVTLKEEATSDEAKDFVREWSEKDTEIDLLVGGEAKFNQEIFDEIMDKVWIGIGLVLISTYFILLFAFRSAIIPLKAIIMNVVGLASTFGILVWIFQGGHFGIEATTIALIIPVFVFSIVFGLSMDYEVFLISRIHEVYQEIGDNDEATVSGLASTSKIITSAALIMIVITGAFAFTDVVPVKQIGIGIALAILIDATIIRLLLVPSLMKLLGEWNWWMPFAKKRKSKKKGN